MKHCNLNASLNQSSRLYLNTYHYSPWIAYVYLTYNLMSIVLYGWNDMVGTLWRCGQQVVVGIVGCFNNRSPFPPSLRKETAFFIMWWKEQIVNLHMHKMYNIPSKISSMEGDLYYNMKLCAVYESSTVWWCGALTHLPFLLVNQVKSGNYQTVLILQD